MGDRANIQFHDRSATADMFFYTHWNGYNLPLTLQQALKRGRDRWSDGAYLARIIFCEMVKGNEMETDSFGLSTYLCHNEYPILHVDVENQNVWIHEMDTTGYGHDPISFSNYIETILDKDDPWRTLKGRHGK